MSNPNDLFRQDAAAHRLTGVAAEEYVQLRMANLHSPLPESVTLAHAKAAASGLTGAEATAYVRRQIGIGYPDHYYAAASAPAASVPATAASAVYARRANRPTAEPATKLPDPDSVYAARAAQAKRRAAGGY